MSVTALTNSFYSYVSVSAKPDTANSSDVKASKPQETIKAINEDLSNTKNTSNTYQENDKNTLNNSNENKSTPPYLTGEEILSSRPEKKERTSKELTEEEQKQVEELKSRDREVKNHEQAHIVAGGSYVKGGASYDYQTGPDGKQYAVGGSVNIDTSPVANNPEATIAKAQVIIKAALAPTEPSGQDQKVASSARQMMNEARQELNSQRNDENGNDNKIDKTDESKNSSDENINTSKNTASSNLPSKEKESRNGNVSSYNIGSFISLTA